MNSNIDLSIIIPLYQGREYIEKTVNSINEIKHSKEIIIVDDGSPDDSYGFCVKLFASNPSVRVYKKENEGVAEARNFGLSKAKGHYCCFVDQDDTLIHSTVDIALDQIHTDGSQMLFWATDHLLSNGLRTRCGQIKKTGTIGPDIIEQLLISAEIEEVENSFISVIGHIWAILFDMLFIEKVALKFKKFVDYEDDYLFIIDALAAAQKISLISEVGYLWFNNSKSYSNSQRHIDNIIDKYKQLTSYSYSVLKKVCNDQNIITQYMPYSCQKTTLAALKNECSWKILNSKGIIKLVRYYRWNNIAQTFKDVHYLPKLKIDKMLCFLCRHKMIYIACFFVFVYSLIPMSLISRLLVLKRD